MLAGAIINHMLSLAVVLFATGFTPAQSAPTLMQKVDQLLHGAHSREYLLIPMWAKQASAGKWHLRLRGYVLDMHEKPGAMFGSAIAAFGAAVGAEHKEEMKRRLRFAYSSLETNPVTVKDIQITDSAGKTTEWLPVQNVKTNDKAAFDINTDVALTPSCKSGDWISVSVRLEDNGVEKGTLPLVGEKGWTVISDIDDTIRDSKVLQKTEALKRLFYLPDQAVTGMPELYLYLMGKLSVPEGAGIIQPTFHYLSASPYELHHNLAKFLEDFKFPQATILPSPVRLQYLIQQATMDLREYKRSGTISVIKQFPGRKYILSGDSGQMDPEAYGDVVRMFDEGKSQVSCILIRQVIGQNAKVEAVKNTKERFSIAFKDVPKDKWRVFKDPSELMKVQFDQGGCYTAGETNQWFVENPAVPAGGALGTVDGGKENVLNTEKTSGAKMHPIGAHTYKTGEPIQVVTLPSDAAGGTLGF